MPYPENRATLDGLLIPVCKSKPFMDDLDNNQFQPNQLHDVADDTVALNDAENRANHDNNNIVHLINNREWTNKQKHNSRDQYATTKKGEKLYETSKRKMGC